MKSRLNKAIILATVAMGLMPWANPDAAWARSGAVERPVVEEPAAPQPPDEQPAPAPIAPPGEGWGPPSGTPGRGPWRGGDAPSWEQMSAEEKSRVREFIAQHFPLWAEEIDNLASGDADQAARHMNRFLPEIARLRELSERDPDLFGVTVKERRGQFEMRKLVQQYRRATDNLRKAELEGQIKDLAAEQFDIRQQRMTLEIGRLEKRLAELRANVDQQATDRQQIIDRDVTDILQGKRGPSGDRPHQFRDGLGRRRQAESPLGRQEAAPEPKPEN